MESQKDRFIRKFMYMVGTRKERILDMQSIERQQRQMPQGQIDLGIYPGAEEPQDVSYGFRLPLNTIENEFATYEESGTVYGLIDISVSHLELSENALIIIAPDLTIEDCLINGISSRNILYNLNGQDYQGYSTTFKNCTFQFDGTAVMIMKNCIFERCDLTSWHQAFVDYYTQGQIDRETLILLLSGSLDGNTFIDCKVIDIADVPVA